jgi:hypothetical protein
MEHDTLTVTELAERLDTECVDWEPRTREQPYRPVRRRNRVGL